MRQFVIGIHGDPSFKLQNKPQVYSINGISVDFLDLNIFNVFNDPCDLDCSYADLENVKAVNLKSNNSFKSN